jgi:metal-responsive CopG/Arc/MetJ family transcriptional regulator
MAKKLKAIDIRELQAAASQDVALYYDVLNELDRLSDLHPTVSRNFICTAILKQYNSEIEWFKEMQEYHRQSIEDSIKNRKHK